MYLCNICDEKFKTVSERANHSRWKHKEIEIIKCENCKRIFNGKAALGNHKRTCGSKANKLRIKKEESRKLAICSKCNFYIGSNRLKHFNSCNGLGTKKKKPKIDRKSKEFRLKMSNAIKLKYKEDPSFRIRVSDSVRKAYKEGRVKINPLTEINRREKIRLAINKRYSEGWEVKSGRALKYDYESPIAGKIKVDGTWELKVAKYLDSLGLKWKRNKERFKYINLKNSNSTYCPDFYIEDWNSFLEIKGYTTDLDRCKWKQFKSPLIIWTKKELKEKGII